MHHPDTAQSELKKGPSTEFIKVSEAWSILSEQELRAKYDAMRNIHNGISSSPEHRADGTYISGHPIGYSEMKTRYVDTLQGKAGGSITDTQVKRSTERWQNMSLKDKKVRTVFCNVYLFLVF